MEDRPSRGVQMVAAGGAGPRLPLLFGLIAPEDLHFLALRALGMFAVRRVALAPQVLKAGGIVGELREELRNRVVRGRGLRPAWFVAVGRWHVVKLLDKRQDVKSLDNYGSAGRRSMNRTSLPS